MAPLRPLDPAWEHDPARARASRPEQLARVLRRRAHRVRAGARARPGPRSSSACLGACCARSRTARPRPTARSRGALGNPRTVRAVGLANGRNPISIVVPCHRVIGADGSLVGFGGGLERKRALLAPRGARSRQDFVQRCGSAGAGRQPRRRERACASSQASRSSSTAASRSSSWSPGRRLDRVRPPGRPADRRRGRPCALACAAVTRLARRS